MSRNRLYLFLSLACMGAYIWLGYNSLSGHPHTGIGFCPFKKLSGIPCPACGTTRAVLALLQGHIADALHLNPLAVPVLLFLVVTPLWIAADMALQQQSYWRFYHKTELLLSRKAIAIPAILLMITNWIWNISKGL